MRRSSKRPFAWGWKFGGVLGCGHHLTHMLALRLPLCDRAACSDGTTDQQHETHTKQRGQKHTHTHSKEDSGVGVMRQLSPNSKGKGTHVQACSYSRCRAFHSLFHEHEHEGVYCPEAAKNKNVKMAKMVSSQARSPHSSRETHPLLVQVSAATFHRFTHTSDQCACLRRVEAIPPSLTNSCGGKCDTKV